MTGLSGYLEVMCRAHDEEDAAQRGEPSPWFFDDDDARAGNHGSIFGDTVKASRATRLSVLSGSPRCETGSGCARTLCALGFAPFNAEKIDMWH